MNARAKLTIVLKADDTVVAETEDPALWQQVLSLIHSGGGSLSAAPSNALDMSRAPDQPEGRFAANDKAVAQFARRLNVSADLVEGALSPSREPPYVMLNEHHWEAFRKSLPQRGVGAIPPIAIAGTIVALWLKEANLGVNATQAIAAQVLDAIGSRDPNPSRGIRNAEWLQARAGGVILINPAEISQAVKVVRGFCQKKAPDSE